MTAARTPPLRSGAVPVLQHYPAYRRDPLAFWRDTAREGPVLRVRLGPFQRFWVVSDPDLLDHILRRRARDYPRDRRLMRLTRGTGPELLFNTPRWDEWLFRRRLLRPGLHGQVLARSAATIVTETEALAGRWRDGEVVDLAAAMKSLTMRIILGTMFGAEPGAGVQALQRTFEVTSRWTYRQASAPVATPLWLPSPANLRAWRARRAQLAALRRIAVARLCSVAATGDLLDLLLAAHAQQGRLRLDEVVGEMGGIVFAGHETTAITLMWLLAEIARDPELAVRLQAEVDADGDHLPLVEATILEALRKYPPVYVTLREASIDDDHDGLPIPEGTRLVANIRGVHHRPDLWPEPERFDPGRFVTRGPRPGFLPFLEGARKCLGEDFAMLEMRLVVAALLRRWRLRAVDALLPAPRPGFVMAAAAPVRVEVHRR